MVYRNNDYCKLLHPRLQNIIKHFDKFDMTEDDADLLSVTFRNIESTRFVYIFLGAENPDVGNIKFDFEEPSEFSEHFDGAVIRGIVIDEIQFAKIACWFLNDIENKAQQADAPEPLTRPGDP